MNGFLFPHGNENPRNSEGSFAGLSDGRILFAWSKYTGRNWKDHCSADIWGVTSSDCGKNWSDPHLILKHDGLNVMSVSLLRIHSGKLAMVTLHKSVVPGREDFPDCRPMFRYSEDDGMSWSDPVDIADVPPLYLVVHNDRLIQLKNNRLILPATCHRYGKGGKLLPGIGIFFLSDDEGKTWYQSLGCCYPPETLATGLQESGVVELEESTILCWFRTGGGFQYKSFSSDGGNTWTHPVPAPEFPSPEAPLSMKRNYRTKELCAVWVDTHPLRRIRFDAPAVTMGRTPLVLARSRDEGNTWTNHRILEDSPSHGYSYTAMYFTDQSLLLAYCCGGTPDCECMLQDLKIVCIPG